MHPAAERERGARRELDGAPVQDRQRARAARGRPGHSAVFGSAPKRVEQPQKILVAVSSCAWISRPMTGSNDGTGDR